MSTDRSAIRGAVNDWLAGWTTGFDRFWFIPRRPTVLGLIRLLAGMIVFYTHAVWTLELETFFSPDGLLPAEYRQQLFATASWSHLDWLGGSPAMLWTVHGLGLIVLFLFMIGFLTRITSVLAALLVISYANRTLGAGFGLDQLNALLCLYCAVGNSGGAFSVDRWLAFRRDPATGSKWSTAQPDTLTNIAVRLIQVHLCIVYLFAAIGKLQGDTWWTGEAVWLAFASYEYQTVDMTWMANYLPLVSFLTLASLFWELAYPALVWPRLTRPIMLIMAVLVHLGIGMCMGMMTFGMIMIVANLSFIESIKSKPTDV